MVRGRPLRIACDLGDALRRPDHALAVLSLLAALIVLAVAQPAAAQVQPAGTGEPAYTNSQQNTQWLEWPATSGADAYRIQYSYYANNALVANPTFSAATTAGTPG